MEQLKQYLWIEFSHSTIPKYYKYFEEWFSNLTDNQVLFYTAYMNGLKTPYFINMTKYIDAEKLKEKIDEIRQNWIGESTGLEVGESGAELGAAESILDSIDDVINSLQQEQIDMGEVSDGYHTFNELYYYRMLYNAAFFNLLPKEWVHKSKRHHTGEECFGGGWFIVMANLPTGQISNHYELKDWDLFQVPEKEFADEWDGHTPQEAAERLHKYLQQEQPEVDLEKEINACWRNWLSPSNQKEVEGVLPKTEFAMYARHFYELGLNARKEENK